MDSLSVDRCVDVMDCYCEAVCSEFAEAAARDATRETKLGGSEALTFTPLRRFFVRHQLTRQR
jgi:hypothetical protein